LNLLPTKPAYRALAVLFAVVLLAPAIVNCADEEELSIDEETPEAATPAPKPAPTAPAATAPATVPSPAPAVKPAPAAPAPTPSTVPTTPAPASEPAPEAVPVEASPAPETAVTPAAPVEEPAQEEETTGENATEEPGTAEEAAPEENAVTAPAATAPVAPVAAPAVVPAEPAVEPEPEIEAETVPPAKEEAVEPPASGPENDLTIDESESPAGEEGEGVADEETVADSGPVLVPAFQWNPRDSKGAFAEFLNAGIPDTMAGYFPAQVVSMAQESRVMAMKSDDIIISGNWRRGQVLAVYRRDLGSRISKVIGLVLAVASSGKGNTRATIIRSDDSIESRDSLLPIEQLQEQFADQRNSAGRARLIQAGAEGSVVGVGAHRSIYSGGEDLLLVSRGKRHGVGLAWLCELIVPGKTGGTTYGRVVRVDAETSFVKVMKLYQTVQTGDRVRLSISPLSEPGAKSNGKR